MRKVFLLLIFSLILTGCSVFGKWTAIYYPDRSLPGKYEIGPEFSEKATCLLWGEKKAEGKPNATYGCGKGCKVDDLGFFLCDKTERTGFQEKTS